MINRAEVSHDAFQGVLWVILFTAENVNVGIARFITKMATNI
jgi:hypothetical protein